MKYCSSIDTDDILFKIVSEAVTSGKVVINGGVFTQGERPDDSEAEDIVINTITVTHDKPQTGTSNVNIYAKDLKLRIKGKEQRKAARRDVLLDRKPSVLRAQHRSIGQRHTARLLLVPHEKPSSVWIFWLYYSVSSKIFQGGAAPFLPCAKYLFP